MITRQSRQSGFFLIEAMVALVIFGTLAAYAAQQFIESKQDDSAKYTGERLAVYNSSVRSYLAKNAPTIVTGTTFTGINWLRTSATCGVGNGTGAVDYLPCSFLSTLPFNLAYTTVFTKAGSMISADTNVGRIVINGGVRIDLSEIAKIAASGAGSNVGSQVNAASPITASVTSDYNVDYSAGASEGNIHAITSNNPTTDGWIRTDGSNSMLANLDMGGNDIVNVRDGLFSRDITVGNNLTAVNTVTSNISKSTEVRTDTVKITRDMSLVAGNVCYQFEVKLGPHGGLFTCIDGAWVNVAASGGMTNTVKYDNVGTYYFYIPRGVASIKVDTIGGGGGGSDSYYRSSAGQAFGGPGGGGGGEGVSTIPVKFGDYVLIVVGQGGSRFAGGGASYAILNGLSYISLGYGGGGGTTGPSGYGGQAWGQITYTGNSGSKGGTSPYSAIALSGAGGASPRGGGGYKSLVWSYSSFGGKPGGGGAGGNWNFGASWAGMYGRKGGDGLVTISY